MVLRPCECALGCLSVCKPRVTNLVLMLRLRIPAVTQSGCGRVYYLHNSGLWGEQNGPLKQVQNDLREPEKEAGLEFCHGSREGLGCTSIRCESPASTKRREHPGFLIS